MGSMSPQPRLPGFRLQSKEKLTQDAQKVQTSHPPTFPEEAGRLFFTARIERPPLYRGGSASKKNGLPASAYPSEAARCASKGIVPATLIPIFQHPAKDPDGLRST
jgi:hypothetical protein